jgi:hypothetical protein
MYILFFSALSRELNEPSRADSVSRYLNELSRTDSLSTPNCETDSSALVWWDPLQKSARFPHSRWGTCWSTPNILTKTVSSNVLYIHPLYLSFTVSSKRFHPLYLISLQQRSLNHVLYTQIPILKTFFNFIFCTYVFIILSNILYIF